MTRAGRTLDVLIKVDVGLPSLRHRPGRRRRSGSSKRWPRCPAYACAAFSATPGHGYHATSEDAAGSDRARRSRPSSTSLRDRAAAGGIALDEISVGATPTLRFSAGEYGLTELRPGNYVYFDRTQVALGAAALDDCALTVLATVVSKPSADRIILDCGSKTLTNDQARGITPAAATVPSWPASATISTTRARSTRR